MAILSTDVLTVALPDNPVLLDYGAANASQAGLAAALATSYNIIASARYGWQGSAAVNHQVDSLADSLAVLVIDAVGCGSVVSGGVVTYYLRGWDTGANNFVYWSSVGSADFAPTVTIPALTGALVGTAVVGEAA